MYSGVRCLFLHLLEFLQEVSDVGSRLCLMMERCHYTRFIRKLWLTLFWDDALSPHKKSNFKTESCWFRVDSMLIFQEWKSVLKNVQKVHKNKAWSCIGIYFWEHAWKNNGIRWWITLLDLINRAIRLQVLLNHVTKTCAKGKVVNVPYDSFWRALIMHATKWSYIIKAPSPPLSINMKSRKQTIK